MIATRWARTEKEYQAIQTFLAGHELAFESQATDTVILYEDDCLVGTGSLDDGVLKCIAISPSRQGEGLVGTILTSLVQKAYERGFDHLFIYTKPDNLRIFKPFGFHPIAKTQNVLLLENRKQGIQTFVKSLPGRRNGVIGSIVMNANPFTLGHRYLVESALRDVDELQVFVLSSQKSIVPPQVRLKLVREGCADLEKVLVQESGDYLVSTATFPTYFLPKDRIETANAELDICIFMDYFVPELHISKRFLGTEPLSPITNSYNQELLASLPKEGVEVQVLERKQTQGDVISASRVRALMKAGDLKGVRPLVPDPTWEYLHSEEGRRLFQAEKT
ncbi:MAG: [citrate (pro-3S)-lyase] ligase [Spirochaetia bacterium]|nr:[citrate (pro-3S)-lyase] ligase [Spirochaetia bacterium]NCC89695.1 [citrate (pro-3S)-lyase] ligase [Spirochaetia bacterium]